MYIGKTLRHIRKSKKISLTELSEKSGVQIATLSRIEHLKMVGTLESHINIAKVLEIDVTELYQDIDKLQNSIDFVDNLNPTEIFTHSEQCSFDILTKNILHKKMMPILISIEPQGKTNQEQLKPGSEKFIFILDGAIDARINDQAYTLNKSNTLYFQASHPHTFINIGKITAKILCISTPVSL